MHLLRKDENEIQTCLSTAALEVAVKALFGLGPMECVAPVGLCAITPPAPPPLPAAAGAGVHRVCLCVMKAEIGNCFLHLPHWKMSSSSAVNEIRTQLLIFLQKNFHFAVAYNLTAN